MCQSWQARIIDQQKYRPNDNRTAWQVDRSRIIHAAAFRRLQAKTQIMGIGLNDFYRTRLTHSLEVAQIGSGLLRHLKKQHPNFSHFPSGSLLETLCLAHDIGHPPFGHGGEIALNYMMREHGGFEGNAQTLRIVSKLEPYSNGYGMNLTRRTLLGFIKYPAFIDDLWHTIPPLSEQRSFIKADHWRPAKGLYKDDKDVFDWIVAPLSKNDQHILSRHYNVDEFRAKTHYKSIDSAIMELADDIAYAVHDLEDAIATEVLTLADWQNHALTQLQALNSPWLTTHLSSITARLFSHHEYERKDAIGELVNTFIIHANLVVQNADFESEILQYTVSLPDEFASILNVLKHFVFKRLIREPKMQQVEFKGQNLLIELFSAFASDPMRLLPETTQEMWLNAHQQGDNAMRIICDYLSGMSDEYAYKTYQRLFLPSA
ncbi:MULTISPECIES: anti-phage deoxyguanosine triphosphatase [Pseudoalteromonas]|jgi:dGTPase|uniref:Deoxyguanosinetriphosphate triphosphohydrolase-like protein n=1 Tax=Pseudoalteromonas lipolytica TaxID=570156 RepID=A0AAD0RZS8_9GAMM|nr:MULTISPECIES: anti-phage deoxyguanosine triphosphatase [Pseudoalteromonas]AXV65493.1 deoxyguanosinetriphosphate triphosphohydrolase family protein [Pseudoalteromonas donghaensis]EWH06932.1 deoxyguanosinetriphosphate triphosphohydrolase [Pseudoalteromonas lipolytica SCSIO 04301]MBE0350690.1 dGTPase [Pseudoalteromonas lipolytica LMEB 39]MCC9658995.1 deoxyguanosinetriphosphate triphosphohydrolase family protein [Pseudoalteromonas sp. MB41]QLJ07036.1 deoxyguanosinetriphosphate triphosphohydrola|tara:strand:- start:8417 stop:9712 length:1296 start_codon:yes stop_codon:yes gene_type:complete